MKRIVLSFALAVGLIGAAFADGSSASSDSADAPAYTTRGELKFPADYRDWNFITSGLGMSYSPLASASMGPMFDNVFVTRSSLAAFRQTGRWPDPTVFVIEARGSTQRGSINRAGRFQNDLMGFDVEVKDSRVPGTWHYYGFDANAAEHGATAAALPATASCYACHAKNTAVEHTFVQFYPALLPIAKAKGTINPWYRPNAFAHELKS